VSCNVSRRTREIGIRSALGAGPRRILSAIVSRTLLQVGLGVVAGAVLEVRLSEHAVESGLLGPIAALMVLVGLLACALPARRALRIQPTEALK
jgi:putative ABC transport system permease protein